MASQLTARARVHPSWVNRDSIHCQKIKRLNCVGGTNHQIDLANPSNLGEQGTDSGVVPNLKWRFSDSKTKIFPGGWVREQVIQDLPQSHDIAAAQQHLKKGAIRELHWHRVVSYVESHCIRLLI